MKILKGGIMKKGKRDGSGPRPDCPRKDGSGSGKTCKGPRRDGSGPRRNKQEESMDSIWLDLLRLKNLYFVFFSQHLDVLGFATPYVVLGFIVSGLVGIIKKLMNRNK